MPVLSLPSEKAPAPPSPNCTLLSVSRVPVVKNLFTFAFLFSIQSPLSSITGLRPASARHSPAVKPPGPKPTTTGRKSASAFFII